ncbi:MAG: hypothetical protein JWO86_8653 [Myxococcaceae bacterium]|nr:hypothetical protein [Myxococcaceae bacterium]
MARSKLRTRDVLSLPVVLAIAALASGGCSGKDPYRPGESIGIFHVTGKLIATSCGATPDPWEFDVRLRHDSTTLYWVQGDAPISAILDATAKAVLTSTATLTARAVSANDPGCTMARTDTVELVLAPMAAPVTVSAATEVTSAKSFTGSLKYHFEASGGSLCDDQLTDNGGQYAALPCDVQYELGATRTGDAK